MYLLHDQTLVERKSNVFLHKSRITGVNNFEGRETLLPVLFFYSIIKYEPAPVCGQENPRTEYLSSKAQNKSLDIISKQKRKA